MDPRFALLTDALPATGNVPYSELKTSLETSGKGAAMQHFHDARRAGAIHAGFEKGVYVVSRFPIRERSAKA